MASPAKPVPDGYGAVTPYLIVRGGKRAIDFYVTALGAKEMYRLEDPKGRIGHAELALGSGRLMLADEHPEMGIVGPESIGGYPLSLHLYVDDVDRTAERFVAAGGKVVREVADQFYGDRGGKFEDPFGHVWWLATHREDVSPDEIQRRAAKLFG
jgi:PhnB protein